MRRLCSAMWFLFALAALAMPVASNAQIINITIAPPELPIYEQPAIPATGYIWAPGYWAFDPDNGYYWVPGTWVQPPDVGLLWTPGYWGWRDGLYVWNDGYWGQQVGFYGGVDYGYGYGGAGYEGGYWDHGVFAYNRTVNNFGGVAIVNVYERPIIVNPEGRRVSFNGGNGGTTAQPTAQDRAAAHERHVAATPMQTEHQHMASTNKALFVSQNHGQPLVAATAKAGQFSGKGVVAAKPSTASLPASKLPGTSTSGTNPTGSKTFEEKGTAGKGLAVPNNAVGSKTFEHKGTASKVLTTPGTTSSTGSKPVEEKALVRRGSETTNNSPPKSVNLGTKPVGSASPTLTPKPNPPPRPAVTAAVKPPTPPSPPAKPACPPGKKMTPAGCK
jgi:WXXGXW repeat (2 copies)